MFISHTRIELPTRLKINSLKDLEDKIIGVVVASSGSARNTAGRTARGAAVGGIIGGRSGARTGAKVVAGVSVLTRGQSINIPAGTLLDFTLAVPFRP